MNILMINGSPRKQGNTYIALQEMEKIFAEEGINTEIIHIGNRDIRSCIACNSCLMRSIALGREKYGLPEKEAFQRTNFIR